MQEPENTQAVPPAGAAPAEPATTATTAGPTPEPAQPSEASDQPAPTAVDTAPEQTPSVFTRYNANEQTYELVADVEGVPVVFSTVKAGVVQGAQGQAQAASPAPEQGSA